jgi:hypothetical protein
VELTTLISSFQETGGQVVIDTEHFGQQPNRVGRIWITQTTLSDYVGTGYLSALPDIDLLFTLPYTTSPELKYGINITTTGVYTVWLRGYAPNAAGDSVYVGLDAQQPTILTGFAPGVWSWAAKSSEGGLVTMEIDKPGLHTLRIWQREDGIRLDRILLTTDSGYNPTGNGPSESEFR